MKRNISRVLLTGQSGILGSELVPLLDGRYELMAISRNPKKVQELSSTTVIPLDISDLDQLNGFLKNAKFDIIINCAAMTDVDRCEVDRRETQLVNSDAVGVMAGHCKNLGIPLIHISTDYLFDGHNGPYSEDAAPNPLNYYGKTKLDGEKAILSSGCEHIIIRTSFLYGRGADGGSRIIRWILDARKQSIEIRVASDVHSNPTYSANLADAVRELLESDFRGVINVAGADYLSRYDFIMAAAEIFGMDKSLIKNVKYDSSGYRAPRPMNAGLRIDFMKNVLDTAPIGVKEGLGRLRNRMDLAAGKEI